MVTINEMVQNLSVKHFNKIKEICEPLGRYFGINHFFMTKTMSNGQCFSVGSHAAFQEFYYPEKKFIWNPLHGDPKNIQSGIYSYSHVKYSKMQEMLAELKCKMDVNPILVMVYKEKDQLIRFGYCTSLKIEHSKALLMLNNNMQILKMFNRHFLKEMSFLLDNGWNNSISLKKEMGEKYCVSEFNEKPLKIDINDRIRFLNDLGILSSCDQLSSREIDYLNFIAQGMTSKQIAQHMNRSIRTVENYIEKLKFKLGSKDKADLTNLAQFFA